MVEDCTVIPASMLCQDLWAQSRLSVGAARTGRWFARIGVCQGRQKLGVPRMDANSRQEIEGWPWVQAGKRMCREGREGRWEGTGRESKQRRTVICVHSTVCEILGCISSDWHVLVIQWVGE